MKNIDKKELKIDAMATARNNPLFKQYSKEAKARILLATEIYNTRVKKGLSQQQLAKNIHSTQKEISKIENGQINVGIDLIFKIAQALNLKIQFGKICLS